MRFGAILAPIIPVLKNSKSIPIEVESGKTLNINPNLSLDEQKRLFSLLKEHKGAFAWEYTDMKGIPSYLCTHHIYIKSDSRPVCQPQRRMNPNLRDIAKEEIHKILEAGFIYPISDSEWVSPLVIVPKKNGKWRVCVDYRELNKATQKDHFPCLSSIKYLTPYPRTSFSPSWMGLAGRVNYRFLLKTRLKLSSPVPGGLLHIEYFPLAYAMHQPNFKEL